MRIAAYITFTYGVVRKPFGENNNNNNNLRDFYTYYLRIIIIIRFWPEKAIRRNSGGYRLGFKLTVLINSHQPRALGVQCHCCFVARPRVILLHVVLYAVRQETESWPVLGRCVRARARRTVQCVCLRRLSKFLLFNYVTYFPSSISRKTFIES